MDHPGIPKGEEHFFAGLSDESIWGGSTLLCSGHMGMDLSYFAAGGYWLGLGSQM
jgi:hypothetical protein